MCGKRNDLQPMPFLAMKQKQFILCFILFATGLFSCATPNHLSKNSSKITYRVVECPSKIREMAVFYAGKYVERETVWEWGARDYLGKKGILSLDCSGFMVRIFQYAVKGTKYSLLFEDAPVSAFYGYFTIPIDTLTPGDIIFMGNEINEPPTHMSIFINMDAKNIYFIDATFKEEDGINGATLRHYSRNDPRFLSYARLLVRY
jgi:cell wall-associated NlpC family hydrolase